MTDTLVSLGNLQRYAGRVKTVTDGKLSTTGGVMTGGIAFGGTAQLTGDASNHLKFNGVDHTAWSLPDYRNVSGITAGASGTHYVAQGDGYLHFWGEISGSGNGYLYIDVNNVINVYRTASSAIGYSIAITIPVCIGDDAYVEYGNFTLLDVRFIHAK